MNWAGFKRAAPELARRAEKMFKKSGVILLGSIRKDGSPRISPVEPLIVKGDMFLGMMWRSLKALDLLRDPRCTIHNAIKDRFAKDGEFKLHGRAKNVRDLPTRKRYCDALYKKIKWAPKEPHYHLFAIDIRSAGLFTAAADTRVVKRWKAGGAIRVSRQTPETVNPS